MPSETLAGLYRSRSGCGREGIQQTRTHSRRIAGCYRRLVQQDRSEGVIVMRVFPRSSNDVSAVVGVLLLVVPIYFVTRSALRYDVPGLKFFGSPILIIGTLAIAFGLNERLFVSV